jgi:hypothetical protein
MRAEKEELLKRYAKRKVNQFLRFDASVGGKPYSDPDELSATDKDGDCITEGTTYELMNSPFIVRVLVRPNAEKKDVIRTLTKITKWIRRERFEANP